MPFLLDSNIVIHAADGHASVLAKLDEHAGNVVTSAICHVELRRGQYRDHPDAADAARRLDALLPGIPTLSFDADAVTAYDRILAARGWMRSRDIDTMIAAHALSSNSTLVTDNTADFAGIPGLKLENWAEA